MSRTAALIIILVAVPVILALHYAEANN